MRGWSISGTMASCRPLSFMIVISDEHSGQFTKDFSGNIVAFRIVVRGLDRILHFFQGLARKGAYRTQPFRIVMIDGFTGFVSSDRGAVLKTTALEF